MYEFDKHFFYLTHKTDIEYEAFCDECQQLCVIFVLKQISEIRICSLFRMHWNEHDIHK